MGRILLAIRAFFLILFDGAAAGRVARALGGGEEAAPPEPRRTAPPKTPTRSEALTLLAALQREARLIDFVKESLDGYADAQVGAVARDVHRDLQAVVERMFAVRPLLDEAERAEVEVPAGFDSACYRLTGNVAGEPPFRGVLAHHGWRATACRLPQWTGDDAAARVVAPAEVELK